MQVSNSDLGYRRTRSWYVLWPLAGALVAFAWLIFDFALIPGLGLAKQMALNAMIALDYARIFTWPSSLIAHYTSGALAAVVVFASIALNAITYLAVGWLFYLSSKRDRRLLALPVALVVLWFAAVLYL